MQPRLTPVAPPYPPELDEDLTKLMPPGVPPLMLFRTMAHNPRVLRRMRRGGLLDPGSITIREREIVILRTTASCGSEYEWGVHAMFFGAAAGLSEEAIAATALGDASEAVWTPRERLLLELCDELHARAEVPDALWARLQGEFEAAQLVELVVLAGLYHMISFVTNATRLAPEPGAPRFPAGRAA